MLSPTEPRLQGAALKGSFSQPAFQILWILRDNYKMVNRLHSAFLLTAFLLAQCAPARAADINSKDFSADDLFQLKKIWTVDLVFTPEQWTAMTPRMDGPHGAEYLLGPEGGHNGFLANRGLTFAWAHGAFSIDGKQYEDIGVRYKGNGTYSGGAPQNKISMKLNLNKYVKGQKLANVTSINLANNITDPGWMNEELAYRLFRDAGVPAPRSSYARVFVTVTGKVPRRYMGLFSLIEDVDEHFVQDRFGAVPDKKMLGPLLKPVPISLFTYISDKWTDYNQIYDPKTELTPAQIERIIGFCKIVTSGTDEEFAAKLPEYVDLDNFARFIAVDVWLTDLDGILNMGQNYYAYMDPKTGKFNFMAWDQDHGFGQMGRASNAQTENFSIYHPWSSRNKFMERVFAVPAFRELYLARMREFSKTIFQPERIFAQVDDLAPAIRPAIAEESKVAAHFFVQVVADPAPGPAQQFGERLKTFTKARTPLVIDQLDGKSKGDQIEISIR